jgi:hypothetical protein
MAGVGVVGTAVLAAKATPKAIALVEEAREDKGDDLTTLETVLVAAPAYIPSIAVGVSTLVCLFGANALNKRQQAALMSGYALLDNSYKEFKAKVKELYGEEAFDRIRGEIAKDHYDEDIHVSDGKQLYFDEWSGRYFEATKAEVMSAQYELNKIMISDGGVYLNEWYDLVGLDLTEAGEFMGWSACYLSEAYWNSWIEFDHYEGVMDDGLEYTIITMRCEPIYDFTEW